jgi:hypothetical protein
MNLNINWAIHNRLVWKHSNNYGWVVMPFDFPGNDGKVSRTLFRCENWEIIEISKEQWKSGEFIWIKDFLLNSVNPNLSSESKKLEKYRVEHSLHINEDAYKKWIIAKNSSRRKLLADPNKVQIIHRKHIEKLGLDYKGMQTYLASIPRRCTHCNRCSQDLDSFIENNQCIACGWIICSKCGSCGCGDTRNTN